MNRLWETVALMGEIGRVGERGVDRLALTDADKAARDLFVRWVRDAGCAITVDELGNIFARRPGKDPSLPAVAIGSHLDSAARAGQFDGTLGVLSGLEVVRTLNDAAIET